MLESSGVVKHTGKVTVSKSTRGRKSRTENEERKNGFHPVMKEQLPVCLFFPLKEIKLLSSQREIIVG